MDKNYILKAIFTIVLAGACYFPALTQSGYVTGDFHQHTTYTDGSYTMGHMMEMNNKFGLDWWANSEHGGGWNSWGLVTGLDLGTQVKWPDAGIMNKGKATVDSLWRWQSLSEWSFRDILLYRRVFPDKFIIQGYEMNVPGHEHASVGIIGNQFAAENPDVNALARFEYLFDSVDLDESQPLGITQTKNGVNNHRKAVEAATWLQENYRYDSWLIPAHPERFRYPSGTLNYEGWNIEHLRDMNNAAPDVFFGFESIPGHQKATNRGEYHSGRGIFGSYGTTTYGGAGWMCAKVGGVWDALLSEGRRFWLFSSSDCHIAGLNDGDFYPGEYQKTYTYVTRKNDPQALVDGLRSGNSYMVHGDLIDSLYFTIGSVSMGGNFETTENEITIKITLRDPQGENFNTYSSYTNPELNHFDLIAGTVTGKVEAPQTVPADGITGYSDEYKKDFVESTKVLARFGKTASNADPCGVETIAWTEEGGGFVSVEYKTNIADGEKMYFRLRGTNQALNTPERTNECGNPLADIQGQNNAAKAFEDLWFYSNPIFVTNTNFTSLEEVIRDESALVYPNPTTDFLYVEGDNIQGISIFNITGELVGNYNMIQGKIDVSSFNQGVYIIQLQIPGKTLQNKFIKK